MHEIKHDGYRTQVVIESGAARAFTRRGHDWTERYRSIVRCAETLPCASAIIEGEMIMQDVAGRSDFHALRANLDRQPQRLILMAFDLLHLDGRDLKSRPIEERRELLRRLLGPNEPHRPIRAFALEFCRALAEAEPNRFTVALPKVERRGRIFLDYLRNQRTSTAVLPYSVRARESMTVAGPVSWRELTKINAPRLYSAADARKLIRRSTSKALAGWGVADQRLPLDQLSQVAAPRS